LSALQNTHAAHRRTAQNKSRFHRQITMSRQFDFSCLIVFPQSPSGFATPGLYLMHPKIASTATHCTLSKPSPYPFSSTLPNIPSTALSENP